MNPVIAGLVEIGKKNYSVGPENRIHPFVLLQWMKHSKLDPIRLQKINYNFFSHSPDIQYMLLHTVTEEPTSVRWTWQKTSEESKQVAENYEKIVNKVIDYYNVDRSTAKSIVDDGLIDLEFLLTVKDDSGTPGTSKKKKKANSSRNVKG